MRFRLLVSLAAGCYAGSLVLGLFWLGGFNYDQRGEPLAICVGIAVIVAKIVGFAVLDTTKYLPTGNKHANSNISREN